MQAFERVAAARDNLVCCIRDVLALRHEGCDADCPGWFIDHEHMIPVLCDECANIGKYIGIIDDDDVGLLPEVGPALQSAMSSADAEDGIALREDL